MYIAWIHMCLLLLGCCSEYHEKERNTLQENARQREIINEQRESLSELTI